MGPSDGRRTAGATGIGGRGEVGPTVTGSCSAPPEAPGAQPDGPRSIGRGERASGGLLGGRELGAARTAPSGHRRPATGGKARSEAIAGAEREAACTTAISCPPAPIETTSGRPEEVVRGVCRPDSLIKMTSPSDGNRRLMGIAYRKGTGAANRCPLARASGEAGPPASASPRCSYGRPAMILPVSSRVNARDVTVRTTCGPSAPDLAEQLPDLVLGFNRRSPLLQHGPGADGDPNDKQRHAEQRDRHDVVSEEAKRRRVEPGDDTKPGVDGQGDRRRQ
jgi:hypothetical protein